MNGMKINPPTFQVNLEDERPTNCAACGKALGIAWFDSSAGNCCDATCAGEGGVSFASTGLARPS